MDFRAIRLLSVLHVILCLLAWLLSFLCLLAGSSKDFMQSYSLFTLNISHIGDNLLGAQQASNNPTVYSDNHFAHNIGRDTGDVDLTKRGILGNITHFEPNITHLEPNITRLEKLADAIFEHALKNATAQIGASITHKADNLKEDINLNPIAGLKNLSKGVEGHVFNYVEHHVASTLKAYLASGVQNFTGNLAPSLEAELSNTTAAAEQGIESRLRQAIGKIEMGLVSELGNGTALLKAGLKNEVRHILGNAETHIASELQNLTATLKDGIKSEFGNLTANIEADLHSEFRNLTANLKASLKMDFQKLAVHFEASLKSEFQNLTARIEANLKEDFRGILTHIEAGLVNELKNVTGNLASGLKNDAGIIIAHIESGVKNDFTNITRHIESGLTNGVRSIFSRVDTGLKNELTTITGNLKNDVKERIRGTLVHMETKLKNGLLGGAATTSLEIRKGFTKDAKSTAQAFHMHDFYNAHILGFCQGYYEQGSSSSIKKNVTGCVNKGAGYSFDVRAILQHELNQAGYPNANTSSLNWPLPIEDKLLALELGSHAAYTLYCFSLVLIGFAVLLTLLGTFLKARPIGLAIAVIDTVAGIMLSMASTVVTAVVVIATSNMNEYGKYVDISATKGTRFLLLTWVAAIIMQAAGMVWTTDCVYRTKVYKMLKKDAYVVVPQDCVEDDTTHLVEETK